MSAEVTDVSSIQDEDLLRRMWQQTEDFGRKKEIRARMYKLREQRLKEFYTTGEVLSDVLSTSTSSLDEGRRNVNASNLKSSQSSSQIISKSSSYTSGSSGGGYSITHADSLADEGFLTLKTKEIRDSESPTREFHQRQEKNAKNESSNSSAGAGEGYWKIVQESSSGAYESAGTTGEGGEMIIHTTSRNENRSVAGDSKNEGFTTATHVTSSEYTLRKPQPDSGIERDVTGDKSVISTNSRVDTGARNVASSTETYSGKLSSSSSASYSASRNQQYQQNEETSAVTSSTVISHDNSQAISGLEDTNVNMSESTKFSSSTSVTQDVISSSATATAQINNNQNSKHRITQRSQTGELIGKTVQSTSDTPDIRSPTIDQPSGTVTVTINNLTNDGSSSSTKLAEQRTVNELHNLDSFLSTQNTAVTATAVKLGDTDYSSNRTVVSSDKNQNVDSTTDKFVSCSGHVTEDKKDSIIKHDSKFIEHERTSSVVNNRDFREPEDATPRKADEKTSTITDKDKADLQNLLSETTEIPKRGVPTQDTTIGKDGTNTTGQYVTTYQQAYTNKRISVDLSPTHEAFARSLRASPERPTPPSSTRSSSKASLDRSSPDRFNKSPTRSYRNKTSLDNTLLSGITSPDKTPRSKTPPVRATPEKFTSRSSPRHSSPEKTPVHRSSPSRVSPEKTTRYPDRTSPSRPSPEKPAKSPYSLQRESPEKTGKSSATYARKNSETTTKSSENDDSPSVASPDKSTRPSHAETAPSFKTCPEKQQQDETSNVPERKVSCNDKPHDVSKHSATRKTSDSTKTCSSVSNRDSAVKVKTTKEKRRLSSGLSRGTTKKRSSTPGVSPSGSPTRVDEARLTERQSRPRSRGTPSRSSTDSEDNDSDVKSKKLQNEFETGDDISKFIVQTTTSDTETNVKRTEFGKTNTESYTAGEKSAAALPREIERKTGEHKPKSIKPLAGSSPRKDDEPGETVSEDSDLEVMKTKSPLASTTDRVPDKSSNVTSVSRDVSSEDTVNLKKIKRTDSATATAKTTVNKSERESYEPTERLASLQTITLDDVGTNIFLPGQESSDSSPFSSPNAASPTTHTGSPKSALDRFPRDKSPEYSSEGSLVNELYPKRSTADIPREVTSPVKHPRDFRKDSPDSSPDRGNFKPIKCFRTSPEIRPSTLEFGHPKKQAPFKASPEKTKSPTKPFKSKTLDNATTNLEGEIEQAVKPLTEPSTRGEPISFTNADFKKSPKRPNASPVFENVDLSATSTKRETDVFNNVPLAPKDSSPDATKGKICVSEYKMDQNTEYLSTKRASDDQTEIYHKELGTTTINGTSEQVLSGHKFEKPSKLSEKPEERTSEDRYDESKQFQDSARKSRKQDSEVDKTAVQQSSEPTSSIISPRSSIPEKSSATRTTKITVKLTSPDKKYSPQERKVTSARSSPSPSRVLQSSSQQCPSDSSPERESVKRRTGPTPGRPQKSHDTGSSKKTCVPKRLPDTSATPEKCIRKKPYHSFPLPSQIPETPKFESQPSRETPESKVIESKGSDQTHSRDQTTAQTPKRPSRKASLSPHSSPDRASPNTTPRKKYDSSPDSRQSPTPSPRRLSDRESHPGTLAESPGRSPSSSPERHRSPEKKRPAVKPSTKRASALSDNYLPSSSPEKRSRIPSRCVRDSPNQSPARSSEPSTKGNQNMSRPRQSPMHPIQKTSRLNYSPTRTNQSPARQCEQNTRMNGTPARVIQAAKHSSGSPSGHKYETVKPKKIGSENVSIKSAFVRTSSKPVDGTTLLRTRKEPGSTSDRYPRVGSPSKQFTRLSPSKKGYLVAKEPKQDKPGEVDGEGSTDRSSTVSSPETVKTAGDSTAVDGAEFVNTKVTSQKVTAASHKRTEVYIPQLTCDGDFLPSDDAQGHKPISLSSLGNTAGIKIGEIPASIMISFTSDRKAKEDILEEKHDKAYYSQDYSVDDIRDETPPDEFPVEDDSPVASPVQPYSTSGKPQKFPEDVGDVQQTRITSKRKVAEGTSATRYERTTTLTTKISNKSSTTNESRRRKQEPHPQVEEKKITPTILSKHRPRIAAATDLKITRSSSDKNVIRKDTSSPGGVQPRRQTSKPEMTVSRATITRSTASTRQQQVTAVGTPTAIRTTKIPTQTLKPAVTKVSYTTEQKRIKDAPKLPVTTAARNRTVIKNQKVKIRNTRQPKDKLANGISEKPDTSSSEDEEEVPERGTDEETETTFIRRADEQDETYVREIDEIRRTHEEQYASKLTAVRILEDRLLSPSQDAPGVIIQPLKSSRESSPEYPRGTGDNANKPRYADRISEPEDDEEVPRQYKQKTVFQKPTFLPEAVDEECTDDDSKLKTEHLVENSQTKEFPGYSIPRAEQVTDLDEESETDQAPKPVSVADRVSHFLETTRNVLNSVVPSEPVKHIESSPKPLDSPSTVRRARAVFETIASSQTSTHKGFTKQKDTTSVLKAFHDSPKESTSPGRRKPENQRRPVDTSPFAEEQLPDRHDILRITPDTKYAVKRSLINEYPVDENKDSPRYKESYPVRSNEDVEKSRTSSADTRIRRKSPSPERLGFGQPKDTQLRNVSPTPAYPDRKKSATADSAADRTYNTYTKVKPLKSNTPGTKPLVTQPGTSPSTYGIISTDVPLTDKSPHKDDQPIKEFSQQEPLSRRGDSSQPKDSPLAMIDLERTYSQGVDSKQEGLLSSRDESKPKEVEPKDIHTRKQSVREDFPEDRLIQTFTKDTASQREILRQKDILNRPSVFEARRLGQKLTPSKQQEEFKYSYESTTSGYPETYPSNDDILARNDVKYSTDTLTKKSETETYQNKDHPQSIYTHCNVSTTRKDSTSAEQFSTDTYTKRISSKDENSHTTKDSKPRKDYSTRQESEPSSRKEFPKRNDSYPNKEKSLSQISTVPKKDEPESVIPSRKTGSLGNDITPRDSSPTRSLSRTKDKSAQLNDVQSLVTSTEKSPTRKNSSLKDTPPTSKVSYSRKESPTRNYSSPKDSVTTGYVSYAKEESLRESFLEKHSSEKDTSPTRKESYPKGESPREGSPKRKHPSPKDVSPTRKDSYPKVECPRDISPTRKHSSPKDASQTRKDSYPKVESPRDSLPTKPSSPTRKDLNRNVESPRERSPTIKHSSPKGTSPTRRDSYPKVASPRDSSPTRKHSSPKDTSPTRKDSHPKVESPRDSSPTRKHSSPKDTSPTRKDSYPKVESPRDSSPTRKQSSPKDTSPARKDSYSSRVTCNISAATVKLSSSKDDSPRGKSSPAVGETPRDFSPTRQYSVPMYVSPTKDESHPTSKDKMTDNRSPTDGSPISQDISLKRSTVTRPETKPGTPRKDSQSNQYHPKQEPKSLETATLRSSGRFGVNLRRTGSTVGSTIQRRLSGESSKHVTSLNKKGDEPRIEDIFDLELLESMLEKAVGYEQRRSIRAQIRIVRRLLAERSAVTIKSEGKPEPPSEGDFTQFVDNSQDGHFNRKPDAAVDRRQELGEPDSVSFDRRPDDDDDDDDSYQKPSSLSQKPFPETRREPSCPDIQDSKPPARRPDSYSTFPRDSKPAPEKIPDWKSSTARKASKSELSIELKPAAPSSVKPPVKKSSLGEPPREAFPTDSVTSSYGVGPTDENGRPLFGLSALRRRQSANSNLQTPQDAVDMAPGSEFEPEDKPQEIESRPSEICDSSGRPFFGGLRALKATTTTTSKGSSIPHGGDKAPSTESDNVREQRVSSHLRELVTKHEQTSRGNAISQPTAPRQKPRAKLRDSFIQGSQDSESEKRPAEEVTDTRVISQRTNSLRAIIQKHEKIAQDETRSDRVPSLDGDIPDAGDTDILCQPGILKRAHGSDQVVTESTGTTSTTVISSRGILKSDGTVSLKRDIIQGETASRLGEEPVTRITRTQYTYSTPEDKSTAASSYDCDHSDTTRKSSTSSRRSSSGKTPSPERGHLDSDVKLSRITTSSVTSSNSFRRSKTSEEDRSMYDKISSTPIHDDISRRSKVTTDRRSEEDEKFMSSATAFLSQQKTTDENSGILSRSSVEREDIAKTESEAKCSALRDGKYVSSTTTTITRTTPISVRDDFDDTRKTSSSGYGKYSSTTFSRSETGREVTSYFLDSERSRCSSESKNLLHSNDDDESDGYRYVSRTVTESDTPRSSRRYSNEADTDGQVQRSEICYSSSSSVTQNHSAATATVETTTSSRSSTPKQISESLRRRSSATSDVDRDASPIPSTGSSGFSRVVRGGSVRALSQKFQQAAGSANLKQSVSEDVHSGSTPTSTHRTSSAETEGKSFLTNQTRVTGVQDVITRMKNADKDVKAGDSEEDAEARSLLNKFLGAQVMLQGMEPLVKASQSQSAALVSQVERQRVLASQKTTAALTSSKDLEQDLEEIWDEKLLRELLDKCSDYEGRRKIRARLRVVMAEQKACASVVAAALADEEAASEREQEETGDVLRHSIEEGHSESTVTSSSTDGNAVTHTEVTTKTSSISTTSVGKGRVPKAPSGKAMSPFAKFQQLDRQSSSQSTPSSPKTPGGTTAAPLFKFTDPKLSRSASGVKDRLLFWCQSKTKEYKNIQIDNFSTSWSNGLAFCALIHHFLPDAFEYDSLRPEERRKNFELAFRVADEKAGIAPLLDVEDMVIMHKPDWKCVFTYVQSVYRRFKDQD